MLYFYEVIAREPCGPIPINLGKVHIVLTELARGLQNQFFYFCSECEFLKPCVPISRVWVQWANQLQLANLLGVQASFTRSLVHRVCLSLLTEPATKRFVFPQKESSNGQTFPCTLGAGRIYLHIPPYSSQCRKHSFSLLVFFSIQKLIYDYEDKRRFAFVDGLLLLTKVLLEHKGLVEFIIPCTASICHPRELKT